MSIPDSNPFIPSSKFVLEGHRLSFPKLLFILPVVLAEGRGFVKEVGGGWRGCNQRICNKNVKVFPSLDS